ncbi:MAG: beta-ketoacyl-[acyl-carrier-protein] synthase family protein [Nitrospirae bacterium]|nr:beta-ketoacyl-[acyl-carrier-protein] synthase family protein [Nitrospirota bacterium]MBF0535496.1 beta-ketoacyl-[acyl-carrier-protein] synthase family protein [Nitrospirota bacterium]MBF0617372.1 beta-ketoacyl-[acyl-carrier-protein] synthase family protein [Nitrospirota bacterium]
MTTPGKRRVVVTGLGLATALGLEVSECWDKVLSGVSGVHKLNLNGAENSPVQSVAAVSESDLSRIEAEFHKDIERAGEKRTLFALWAAKRALEDAVLLPFSGNRWRFGTVLAAGAPVNRLEDIYCHVSTGKKFDYESYLQITKEIHQESMLKNNSNRAAALIAKKFNLNGVNATVTTACASATQAIGTAYGLIKRGEQDVIAAGGADSMINPIGLVFFVLLGAASVSTDKPELACRPFDKKRSGLVMGEGAGIVILEELQHALSRGAKIYCEVAGYGSSMDAFQVTAPQPDGSGAEASMRAALTDSGIALDSIDYINAHGTSTKLNDTAETIAIKRVFNQHAKDICISSSKSMTGHLLAASGGPEFIFTVLSTHNDEIHPTINLTNPDPKCDLDYVPNVKRMKTVRAALSNSFGFGGQNASVIVKKYPDKLV